MIDRSRIIRRLIAGLSVLSITGCSHRQGTVAVVSPPKTVVPQMLSVVAPVQRRVFSGTGFQFDYPADWNPTRGQTAMFAITAPASAGPAGAVPGNAGPSLNLDVPKLPWHLPGMITVSMVASGYVSDLKKNQIHDAVIKEQCPVTVSGESAKKVTCTGHIDGKSSTDIAVFMVHADHVYILSADSGDFDCDRAKRTLDQVVASWKWIK